jgi:hypothetical protein
VTSRAERNAGAASEPKTKSGRNYKAAIPIDYVSARKIGPALGTEIRPALDAQPEMGDFNFYDV